MNDFWQLTRAGECACCGPATAANSGLVDCCSSTLTRIVTRRNSCHPRPPPPFSANPPPPPLLYFIHYSRALLFQRPPFAKFLSLPPPPTPALPTSPSGRCVRPPPPATNKRRHCWPRIGTQPAPAGTVPPTDPPHRPTLSRGRIRATSRSSWPTRRILSASACTTHSTTTFYSPVSSSATPTTNNTAPSASTTTSRCCRRATILPSIVESLIRRELTFLTSSIDVSPRRNAF